MSINRKIFYLCPDVGFPSGGVKRLYSHVQILRDHDYEAFILHFRKGFKLNWFDSSVPIVYLDDKPPIFPEDTVVIPEGFPRLMKKLNSVDRVVIALSHSYIFQEMPIGENWKHYGINWVMTSSRFIASLIAWSMGIRNIHIIGTSIDREIFNYCSNKKQLQVVYISRKDTLSEYVEKVVKSRDHMFSEVEFIKIENLHIREYAALLRQSEIYLTTSPLEGINRSILEAMACGCICIGFHGIGGNEYIMPTGGKQNFVLAESMDFFDLSVRLADLIEKIRRQDPSIYAIRRNGLLTAADFSFEEEGASLLKFWNSYFESKKIRTAAKHHKTAGLHELSQ